MKRPKRGHLCNHLFGSFILKIPELRALAQFWCPREGISSEHPLVTRTKGHDFPLFLQREQCFCYPLFSLYVKILTSPLDQGPEQEKTCSTDLTGKDLVLHTARPIKEDRSSFGQGSSAVTKSEKNPLCLCHVAREHSTGHIIGVSVLNIQHQDIFDNPQRPRLSVLIHKQDLRLLQLLGRLPLRRSQCQRTGFFEHYHSYNGIGYPRSPTLDYTCCSPFRHLQCLPKANFFFRPEGNSSGVYPRPIFDIGDSTSCFFANFVEP